MDTVANETAQFLWPEGPSPEEAIYLWRTRGGRELRLASNYPYEIRLDGVFRGDGGLRCAPGEVLLDRWNARHAHEVEIRLHFMHYRTSSVWHRCLFSVPFFADLDGGEWQCQRDRSIRFAAKCSSQLPRQNLVSAAGRTEALQTRSIPPAGWSVIDPHLLPPRYLEADLQPVATIRRLHRDRRWTPLTSVDLVTYARREARGIEIRCFDLGALGLHRFEVSTDTDLILAYGEVPTFEQARATKNRAKVHLADAIEGGASAVAPFGFRGCRYLYVIAPPRARFTVRAWRREYPLAWKEIRIGDAELETIVEACRNNLMATVDGGIVDTCWRERAQWVGDLRMSALGLRALAENHEVIDHSLRQIATSYDDAVGMVQGAWPVQHESFRRLLMPTYHLAFCLAVVEHESADRALVDLVRRSLRRWRELYCREGLVRDLPGWHFTDWDSTSGEARRRQVTGAHAVANAWYGEACRRLELPGIDLDRFDGTFWDPAEEGYRLLEGGPASPHATAVAIDSLGLTRGFGFLRRCPNLEERVTKYFGFFVARALGRSSGEEMLSFIKKHYLESAVALGTIIEKTRDESSRAHGWSVAVAQLIVDHSREPLANALGG